MTTAVKWVLGLGVLGGAFYGLYRYGKDKVKEVSDDVVANLRAKLKSFGVPKFSGNNVTVPTFIEITNTNAISIPLDRAVITAKVKQGSSYTTVGTLDQKNVTLATGTNLMEFRPVLDLKALTKNLKDTIKDILKSSSVDLVFDISLTAAGQTLSDSLPYKLKL